MFGKGSAKKHAEPEAEATANRTITGTFNLQAQLPNGRSITVQSYVYSDDKAVDVNGRLDAFQEAIERQRTRCEIPELEARREQHVQALQNALAVIKELEEKARTPNGLSSQERMNLNNLRTSIKRTNEEIEKGAGAIAEAKKKAGVG